MSDFAGGSRNVSRFALQLEALALFGAIPALVAIGPRWGVSLGILSGAVAAFWLLLRDPTFERADLWRFERGRPLLAKLLGRSAVAALIVGFGLTQFPVEPFLFRTKPLVWALIMLFYPISAYAQEVACRTFFFHRYAVLFPSAAQRVLVSGLAFGWAHIAANNLTGMLLATGAGMLFAWTYERSRSTFLAALEHSLYGDFAFSFGLGSLFYTSERWINW